LLTNRKRRKEMIVVFAKCIVNDSHIKEFIDLASELVNETRKEEFYVSYELIRSIDNSNQFVFLEKWESKDTLDVHMNTRHFKSIVPELTKLIEGEMQVDMHELLV
jgi:quinol monooxygenase YgiN